MKYLFYSILLLSAGCGSITTKKYDPTTGKLVEVSKTRVFAQKSFLKGYKVFSETPKGTKTSVSIGALENETQPEVITGSGAALGTLVGEAFKHAK